jgi:hypothetical protein
MSRVSGLLVLGLVLLVGVMASAHESRPASLEITATTPGRYDVLWRTPLLALSLQQPALPAHIYRSILDFLASQPTIEQLAAFGPTPEMTERLQTLLARQAAGAITPTEMAELDEYERIEHLLIMLKAGALSSLTSAPCA